MAVVWFVYGDIRICRLFECWLYAVEAPLSAIVMTGIRPDPGMHETTARRGYRARNRRRWKPPRGNQGECSAVFFSGVNRFLRKRRKAIVRAGRIRFLDFGAVNHRLGVEHGSGSY